MANIQCFDEIELTSNDTTLGDTSFFMSLVGHNSARQKALAINFLARMTLAETYMNVPQIAINEMAGVVTHRAFDRKGYTDEDMKKWLRQKHPAEYAKVMDEVFNSLTDLDRNLFSNSTIISEPLDMCAGLLDLRNIMCNNQMHGSNDAAIIATAENWGIKYVASMDSDFCNNSSSSVIFLLDRDSYDKVMGQEK